MVHHSSSPAPLPLSYTNNSNQSITQLPTATLKAAEEFPSLQPLNGKFESATSGLQQYYINTLTKQSNQNAETIADYLVAITMEANPSIQHKAIIQTPMP